MITCGRDAEIVELVVNGREALLLTVQTKKENLETASCPAWLGTRDLDHVGSHNDRMRAESLTVVPNSIAPMAACAI